LNTIINGNYVADQKEKQFIKTLIEKYSMMPSASAIPPDIPTSKRPIIEEKDLLLESIIGENTLRPISFLLKAIEVSRCVCYVGVPANAGTGFLIGKNILITNNHVIYNDDILDQCTFTFNYQIDVNGKREKQKDYKAKQNGLFHTSPKEVLDYTIVELEDYPGTEWGFAKLNITSPPQLKSRVNIIQHPGGQPKQISIQNNFLEYVDDRVLQYVTSTLPGSSGSPVFDDNWRVVALHHAGGMVIEPQTGRSYFRNQGIRISAIINDLPDNIRKTLD
jgi:V8-like Glu-specific endopeptidase